ncbi:B-cell linker protein-like isoform X1 [Gigantopelta aegis]|uniref:B-cell linker protein-like isoform X1 n=1 Tax=Gigantopelta aegis TaxID=1735272 RepID=UPI001B88AA78|nr:B-cell linker protein-like isoform X1 [Gigantopelta aegis]
MTLPAYGVLVKWTLHDVLTWLEREGLSEFKDPFRKDGIDGSKFCKFQEVDVDRYYCNNKKKKQLLKNHIASIDRSKAPAKLNYTDMWNKQQTQQNTRASEPAAPPLPPSRRAEARLPAPLPKDEPGDNEDVYDWGDDFDDSGGSDFESDETGSDYENTQEKVNGSNHAHHDGSWPDDQDNYEAPNAGLETQAPPPSSLVANLMNALQKHRESKRLPGGQARQQHHQDDDDDENENPDEEDYVEPLQQAPQPPPPRPRRRSSEPAVSGKDVPSHPAPQPPLPHRKADRLPPPPVEEDKLSQRQLPPVPGPRSAKKGSSTLKQNTSENQPQLPPRKTSQPSVSGASTPKKKSSVDEMKDGYEEMKPVRVRKESHPKVVEEQAIYDETDELFDYPWYHSTVDRSKAEKLLKAANKDGMFLIRKSTRTGTDQKFTLMIYNQQKVYNLPVRCVGNDKYVLGKHRQNELTFDTVPELILYFSKQIIQLNPNDRSTTGRTKLIEPLRKA